MDTTQPQTQADIFTRLGMASASDEQKQKLAEQLAELTMVRVMEKVSSAVPEETMDEIEALIDKGADDQVEDRLRQAIPGYDELVQTTAGEVADQIVADQQAVLAKVRSQTTSA